MPVNGQEKPPKPIAVTVSIAQHLNFGTFIVTGSGGSVTVNYNGVRSTINDVYIPSISSSETPTPALFEVTALRGTLITIVNGSPVYLSGSNGDSILLTVGPSSTGTPFVAQGMTTDVFIGGTLTVGSLTANRPGSYSGTFSVTFVQN